VGSPFQLPDSWVMFNHSASAAMIDQLTSIYAAQSPGALDIKRLRADLGSQATRQCQHLGGPRNLHH
jgi:hypothetical protein